MIGLVAKDFIVFKKICKPAYRLLGITLLLCACIFIPQAAIPYISLLLPLMGVAFLTELVKIEEKSDWKNYLPVLPITDKEIVVGRYLFSGILFVSLSVLTFLLCIIAAFTGHFSFTTVVPNLVLGMCCTVLTICLGVPSGFVFKQSNCTGAMIAAIMVCAVIRSTGLDTAFFAASSFLAYTLLIRINEKKRRLCKSKPPLHRRVEMCLLYDGFFSFAVVRQNVTPYSIQCFQ